MCREKTSSEKGLYSIPILKREMILEEKMKSGGAWSNWDRGGVNHLGFRIEGLS